VEVKFVASIRPVDKEEGKQSNALGEWKKNMKDMKKPL